MIKEEMMLRYGAEKIHLKKGEVLFEKNDVPRFFYQVKEGDIKINDVNEDGREFIQEIISGGRSFGDFAIIGDFKYLGNAVAIVDTDLYRLGKSAFFKMLEENPKVHLNFSKNLAKRLHYKVLMSAEIATYNAEHKILTFLDYLKHTIYDINEDFGFEVNLTRQQIADLTGLRVETVIRNLKKLEEANEVKIINRKIFR